LSRPGGNVTGITSLSVEIGPKRLELIHELVPAANILALLVNPTNPILAEVQSRDFQKAARAFGLQLHILHASTERDFEVVSESLAQLELIINLKTAGALGITVPLALLARADDVIE
jgi:putative ABC transport system substrate-binding protein